MQKETEEDHKNKMALITRRELALTMTQTGEGHAMVAGRGTKPIMDTGQHNINTDNQSLLESMFHQLLDIGRD